MIDVWKDVIVVRRRLPMMGREAATMIMGRARMRRRDRRRETSRFHPAIGVPSLPAGGERPGHAVGCRQKWSNGGIFESGALQAEAMKPQVGPDRLDRREDLNDRGRRAVSLAYAADADPHARRKALAVHVDVTNIVRGGVALEDRNDGERTRAVE